MKGLLSIPNGNRTFVPPCKTSYNLTMFIGIVGCMGVGKSRLTEALAKHLGYKAYFEPVKENPYLDDYYADPKRYACVMQFFMLTHRFRQHLEVQKLSAQDIGIVQDQIIYGDVIYAQLNTSSGTWITGTLLITKTILKHYVPC